jgi:ketosteroid isomerase-like protein
MNTDNEIARVVRRCYESYPRQDRAAIEAVLADDFHFTSPRDNRLDRRTYFERCWPNGANMAAIDIQRLLTDVDRVYVTYEVRMRDGRRFRNTELLTVRDGKITDVEVYFGWSIPHPAATGSFVDD